MNEAVILSDDAATGITHVNGRAYMADAKGGLVPLDMIKAADKLEDETVRKIMGFAHALSEQVDRFRVHTMVDLDAFDELLMQEFGAKKGGKKGNRTYKTFDGLMKVQVQVADFVDFGPQLQVAKTLFDECLTEWSEDARPEIRAIITRAFNTDKEGQVNRSDILLLLRLDITDERWQRAMDAIRDAMRITGSREYVRFYQRAKITDSWQAVTIDLAKAGA